MFLITLKDLSGVVINNSYCIDIFIFPLPACISQTSGNSFTILIQLIINRIKESF